MSTVSAIPQAVGPIAMGNVQPYACVRCASRKVKCDKLIPRCSKCERNNVHCEYKAPAPPRRRKRKTSDADIHLKLRHYESLLKKNGLDVEQIAEQELSPESDHSSVATAPGTFPGHDTFGSYRHNGAPTEPKVEQNPLWGSINDIHRTDDASSQADDDIDPPQSQPQHLDDGGSLLLSTWSGELDFRHCMPPALACTRLWRAYKENFDPIAKVIHVPTVDTILSHAMTDPDTLPLAAKTLVLAIFSASLCTFGDDECLSILGESQQKASARYRTAAKQALIQGDFLNTSDDMVFQAFFIYLMSSRTGYSAETLWALNGVALRIGSRLGYYADSNQKKSPFETEIRRRLWWQVSMFDVQVGEQAQQGSYRTDMLGNDKAPLNVNDRDLYPSMTQLPEGRDGPTEMMLSCIRFEIWAFLRRGVYADLFDNSVRREKNDLKVAAIIAEKDRKIEELQNILESKYLRYCDPLNGAQTLAMVMGRCVVLRLKLMAHSPRQYLERGVEMPESEMDLLLQLSLKTLEYETIVQTTPSIKGFKWHTTQHVQWLSVIHILSDLRSRDAGPDTDKAWVEIEKMWNYHPEIFERRKSRPLFRAVCSLANAAWSRREADVQKKTGMVPHAPSFIVKLREARRSSKTSPNFDHTPATPVIQPSGPVTGKELPMQPWSEGDPNLLSGAFDAALDNEFDPMLLRPMDWGAWDELMREFQWQETHSMLG